MRNAPFTCSKSTQSMHIAVAVWLAMSTDNTTDIFRYLPRTTAKQSHNVRMTGYSHIFYFLPQVMSEIDIRINQCGKRTTNMVSVDNKNNSNNCAYLTLRCNGRQEFTLFRSENVHSKSKNCARIHSFITLTIVGRFSKFFHWCIIREICTVANFIWQAVCTFSRLLQMQLFKDISN